MQLSEKNKQRLKDLLFILWAGGAALLSYSFVYALRKPFTASTFEGLTLMGYDYKVVVTTIQIIGYLVAKFIGIKLISEMKYKDRFKYFVGFVVTALISLVFFGLLPHPYNVIPMFFNGLSLGCMWGVIFGYLEGRRVTDILASLLGVSMVISSGTAKSMGLYVMNDLGVDQFWMPALVGAFALPLLLLTGYMLKRLPEPSKEDIEERSERVALDSKGRMALFMKYAPFLSVIFFSNLIILILRDVKEDFLVNIFDMSGHSSWLFARVDSVVTLIILAMFALFSFFKNNYKVLMSLLVMAIASCVVMCHVSQNHVAMNLAPISWLFIQSLTLYITYLTFQTIFFDRFIACFKVKGNIGYFIAIIDFIGYMGTVVFLFTKEALRIDIDWFELYNQIAFYVGATSIAIYASAAYMLHYYKRKESLEQEQEQLIELQPTTNTAS